MGESSSELLGSHKATTKGGSAATTDLEVANAANESIKYPTTNMTAHDLAAGQYVIYSEADHVFVNGVAVDAEDGYVLTLTSGQYAQIITQSGLQSPYITVLHCN